MNIILFGKPGCGKGTISSLLQDEMNLSIISTGDLLRKIKNEDTDIGREVKKTIESGELLSDDLIHDILNKEIHKYVDAEAVLFDGYPRNTEQANDLDNLIEVDHVIYLDVSDETCIKRILERGKTSGRDDDKNIDIIKNRLKIFEEETLPLKTYYQVQQNITIINGDRPINQVYDDVIKAINYR
jgi:adenylate kinase